MKGEADGWMQIFVLMVLLALLPIESHREAHSLGRASPPNSTAPHRSYTTFQDSKSADQGRRAAIHASKQRRHRARWIAATCITVYATCTSSRSSFVLVLLVLASDWASAGSPASLDDANPGIEVEDAADADMLANLATVIW